MMNENENNSHAPVVSEYTDKQLANAIIYAKKNQKRLKEQLDDAAVWYSGLEAEMLKRYEQEGQTSSTFVGDDGRKHTLYMQRQLNPIAKFSYTDECRAEMFRHIVSTYNEGEYGFITARTAGEIMKGIRGAMKELYERDGKIPMEFDDFIEVRQEFKINMRSL